MKSRVELLAIARVFFDDEHQGTQAAIFATESKISDRQAVKLVQKLKKPAAVFVEKQSLRSSPKLSIYNAQQQIQWCGHGLLAAACYLKKHSHSQHLQQLELAAGLVAIEDNKQQLWLGFEPLAIEASEVEPEVFAMFSPAPYQIAKVGGDQGYSILEWHPADDLKQVRVDFKGFSRITNRAIIATQAANDGFDFKLRYFAPQHGIDEDPATGSANRVLATYWQQRLGKSHFVAEQLSDSGAVILSKIEKNKVWISGKVDFLDG
ncbi:PhzF family phenazine biosynthesis protein [Kangiella sp. TOML190]|uniref:PhzF family phenazine biosynthesis protein n=1 Tax=Kangiella sp. TOML190 TaxID=2931351 RepID=UPI002041D8F2|nr:PhzF family phenazine biosynthesis protein [Kangiella sp. TOML190]